MGEIFLSTAAFCLWGISPEKKLELCRQMGFEGVEIALSTERMVRDFQQVLEKQELFSGFRKIALHSPWHGVTYGRNLRSQRVIDGVRTIQEKLRADTVVFHSDCVSDIGFLVHSGLPVCLENSDRSGCWEKLRTAVEGENLPFALNVNMATRKVDHLDAILDQLGHRITRIHISGHDHAMGRIPILETEQLKNLERIKQLAVPMILEGLFQPGDCGAILTERVAVEEILRKPLEGSLAFGAKWIV